MNITIRAALVEGLMWRCSLANRSNQVTSTLPLPLPLPLPQTTYYFRSLCCILLLAVSYQSGLRLRHQHLSPQHHASPAG